MTLKALAFAASAAALFAGSASAQQYVSGSTGFNFQADSDNSGAFTRDFITGDGVAVPAGTTLPNGTDVGWTTEFDTGLFLSGAYGYRLSETLRIEGELSYTSADIDTHTGVTAGGAALGAADAAVLITGSAPLGVTVSDLVADGQGDISSFGYAVNGYYDFANTDLPVDFYLGAGLGIAEVKVDYAPSGVGIVDDTEMVGFYQLMAGASYPVAEGVDLFGGYRFRQTQDAEVDSTLIPATLDIENTNHIVEFGVRYSF
jgi:opacity protein-like surface antigen